MSRCCSLLASVLGVLLLSLTAWAGPTPPKNIDTSDKSAQVFRFKHKAGKKLRFTNVVTQELSIKMSGGDMPGMFPPTRMVMTADLTEATPKISPEGEAEVVTTYDDMKFEMKQGDVTMDEAKLAPMVAELKKIKATARRSPRGAMMDFKMEGAPGAMNMSESMRGALVGTAPEFPEEAIAIGAGWRQEVPLKISQGPMELRMNFALDYKFLGYVKMKKRKLAVFSIAIEIKAKGRPNAASEKVKMDGTGMGTGYLYFDQAAGSLHESVLEMTQEIQVSEPGEAMKMRMSTKMGARMTRRK